MISFSPPKEPFKAYLFDCDGTLADTMRLHYDAWTRAVKEHGGDFDYSPELFYSMAGMTVEDTIARLNETFGTQLDHRAVGATKNALYAKMLDQVEPIAPVVSFCEDCIASGAAVAVVSGSTREDVDATLEAIGLGDKISLKICQGDTRRGKPDPMPFKHAADLLGVAYPDCLVLEDSEHSYQSAQGIGMSAILIPNTML
ncbi:MAG: HAD family hydrolase [Opitutales bacterium]